MRSRRPSWSAALCIESPCAALPSFSMAALGDTRPPRMDAIKRSSSSHPLLMAGSETLVTAMRSRFSGSTIERGKYSLRSAMSRS